MPLYNHACTYITIKKKRILVASISSSTVV